MRGKGGRREGRERLNGLLFLFDVYTPRHCTHTHTPLTTSATQHTTNTSTSTSYLINWCSVQRVAHRCRALSERREALLDSIGFDWTGADPLS